MDIHIAHSPDADDASMFYPIFQHKVDWQGLTFRESREDIETLNKKARDGVYDLSAVSFHAYPSMAAHYRLMTTGACFGDKYGPVIVASKPLKPRQLLKVRMAIPGKKTTAFLVMKLYEQHLATEGKPGLCYTEMPFDQVMEAVEQGKADAGLIIHEGQLSYGDKGLFKIVDLGEWWHRETRLPLPLGAIAIRRSLDEDVQKKVYQVVQNSIRYSIEHQDESLEQSLGWARGLDAEKTRTFIGMYVNELTVDCGRKGLRAIKTLFEKAFRAGLLAEPVHLEDAFLSLPSAENAAPAAASFSAPLPDAQTAAPPSASSDPQA